ncbi:MAG: TldD/PmbA family protein [Dongiaceae bacterium]
MTSVDFLSQLEKILQQAKAKGADAADILFIKGRHLSVDVRRQELDRVENAESQDLGLRLFIGRRQAIVSTHDLSQGAIIALVDRGIAMARAAPADPFAGLAENNQLSRKEPVLDLYDATEVDLATLEAEAKEAEAAALSFPGVTNSDSASASFGQSHLTLISSEGFTAQYSTSYHGLSVSAVAGEGVEMERDYDSTSSIHRQDLEKATMVGRRAAEKAVKRLKPRKVSSQIVPVVFDPRIANSWVRYLLQAINGAAIARGTSFLKDKMGKNIFNSAIHIHDDPHRKRGLRSRPVDAEGIATTPLALVQDGILQSWLLDLRTARQLKLSSTGHAVRGVASPPSPSASNAYMAAGKMTPAELIADIEAGFYVTDTMGGGVNLVTGDYSQGASGFWIEKGQIAYPVSEVTIAGHLNDIFKDLTPANDLVFRYGIDAPTLRAAAMTVAGQ